MSVEGKIAWRYLFSKKGHSAINIVSGVSAAAVAVVTAAMLCVLSVMNGFGGLVEDMFSEFDPEIRITSAVGKSFSVDTDAFRQLREAAYVEVMSEQVSETALIQYKDHQMPALLLGVDDNFQLLTHIDSIISDGYYSVYDGAFDRAVMGRGLAGQLGMNAHFVGGIHIYAPKRVGKINMLRPEDSFHQSVAFIAGTFAVNQVQYDDHLMLVSLALARQLFDYDSVTVTALGLKLRAESAREFRQYKQAIRQQLGDDYVVADRYEQQADFFRILKIEKLLTAILLVFILLIASFNVISSLSMLILDKQDSVRVLRHLGASDRQIRRVFLLEGWLISALGASVGLVIGLALCLMQQQWGLLKLGTGDEYVISAYPVLVEWTDVLLVALVVLLLGFVAAFYPSRKMKINLLLPLVALFAISCKPMNPVDKRAKVYEYNIGYEEHYGQYYDSVGTNVFALDLYGDGLKLNMEGKIVGSGWNLYLSDIFLDEDSLTTGEYHSDTTAAAFTFLPGKDYEGTPHGAYLLDVEDGKVQSIRVFPTGGFQLKQQGDTTDIRLWFTEKKDTVYRAHYHGKLRKKNH